MKKNLCRALAANEYLGRGICVGLDADGKRAMIAYWIMGRSANSRNRVFEALPDGSGIRTVAADPSKMEDPHLIIYAPVRTLNGTSIVTNGDQTDTIYEYIEAGAYPGYSFEAALASRTFEDDAPNYTPRISAVVDMHAGSYKMAILKAMDGNPECLLRQVFDVPFPAAGEGHMITTYQKNGSPLPSFAGEPIRVGVEDRDPRAWADRIWQALNADNRVSLFVRAVQLSDGSYEDVIVNQYSSVKEKAL